MQTKWEIQDMIESNSGKDIAWLILKNLVPKFGNKKLKHDTRQNICKIFIQKNGSFNKLNTRAKDARHTL